MSIDPIATAQSWTAAKKGGAAGAAPAVPFGEFLARGARPEQVSATTAAEILRLKMLSSAVNLGGDEERPAANRSLGVQGLLERFLEQLPNQSGAAAAGGIAGGPAEPGATETETYGAIDTAGIAAGEVGQGRAVSGDLPTEAIIEKASRRYGVDGGLIRAIIKAESNFNPRAVSSAGAQGLMQLMPATARGLGVSDSFDPEQNVMAGTRFLKDMLRRYDGNLNEALAAYNWGPGNVDRHGTDHLPRETRAYLGKVKEYYAQYQNVG
ncbi:MAG: lytic transglycosylase [Geobacteraceae bacterium GWC2_58_44]|nr:MAG: lytic transglycosylase [Geobacteraceae bacterium GWC2_58_44]HBG07573.1 lytic transglycosylase [Geobacter sp.]